MKYIIATNFTHSFLLIFNVTSRKLKNICFIILLEIQIIKCFQRILELMGTGNFGSIVAYPFHFSWGRLEENLSLLPTRSSKIIAHGNGALKMREDWHLISWFDFSL